VSVCIKTLELSHTVSAARLACGVGIIANDACKLVPAAAHDAPKPRSDARPGEKEAYVLTKYVRRRYAPAPAALPGGTVHAAMWEAAKMGDVRCDEAASLSLCTGHSVFDVMTHTLTSTSCCVVTCRL